MPPKKRVKKSRAKKPKAQKQKQKQKQQQKVNVSVSAGGSGGGGTQFIPMPSAPAFDYAQLANLIRPANTVDMPIRAQANPEPMAAKAPEAESLKELTSKQVSKSLRFEEGEGGPTEFESMPDEPERKKRAPRSDKGKSRGSTIEKYTNKGKNEMNEFALRGMGINPSGYTSWASEAESETPVRKGIVSFGELTGGGSSASFV
jgi:hypothetical protein